MVFPPPGAVELMVLGGDSWKMSVEAEMVLKGHLLP